MIMGRTQILAAGAGNERRPPFARVVARARPLDLDDLSTQIGEQLSAPRPRKHPRQFDDADAFERLRIRQRRRSEEHTSDLQSLMRISYAVFCLKKKINLPENSCTR